MSATNQKVFAVSLRGLDALSKKNDRLSEHESFFPAIFIALTKVEGAYV
jgi:hypothetical protein